VKKDKGKIVHTPFGNHDILMKKASSGEERYFTCGIG